MLLPPRKMIQQLDVGGIAESVPHERDLGLVERRWGAREGLEVSTLHRPMKEDVKLPMAGLQDR